MRGIRWVSLCIVGVLCLSLSAYASDFYEWTDENGVTHFADSVDEIPAKYRNQAKSPKPSATPRPAARPSAAVRSLSLDERPGALRRIEIPYQASEGSARRVIIPVTLNDAVTVPMALDTGSPGMVVSFELAERLGVFSRDRGTLLVAAAGIGGVTPAVLTIIDSVSIEGARAVVVPTTVTERLSPAFQGLIGMDFMSGYTVSIDSSREVVVFQENPPSDEVRGGHDEAWWRNMFRAFRTASDRWTQYAKSAGDQLGSRKALVEFQARESERLVQRLHQYASDSSVPQHWR